MYRMALNYMAMKTVMDIRANQLERDTGQSGQYYSSYRTYERPTMARQCCCDMSKCRIAKLIALIDSVKGVCGVVFGIYLSIYLFQHPQLNYDAYNNDETHMDELYALIDYNQSELSYILAFGVTKWGVIISVCTIIVWNLLLILFGKFLWDAARGKETKRLRLWYAYTFFSNLVFFGLYIWFIVSFPRYRKSRLWEDESVQYYTWLVVTWYYFLSFFTTIYSLVIIQRLVKEIDLDCQAQQQYRSQIMINV